MAYGDGGLKPHEIALIKAWYFADPNIPAVWKYGNANAGIFKYRKTGTYHQTITETINLKIPDMKKSNNNNGSDDINAYLSSVIML